MGFSHCSHCRCDRLLTDAFFSRLRIVPDKGSDRTVVPDRFAGFERCQQRPSAMSPTIFDIDLLSWMGGNYRDQLGKIRGTCVRDRIPVAWHNCPRASRSRCAGPAPNGAVRAVLRADIRGADGIGRTGLRYHASRPWRSRGPDGDHIADYLLYQGPTRRLARTARREFHIITNERRRRRER